MPEEFINLVTSRYIELFEKVTGKTFIKQDYGDVINRVEKNMVEALSKM
jgi:phosphoribosylaminoimidazole-succinocarboxamide synthase